MNRKKTYNRSGQFVTINKLQRCTTYDNHRRQQHITALRRQRHYSIVRV